MQNQTTTVFKITSVEAGDRYFNWVTTTFAGMPEADDRPEDAGEPLVRVEGLGYDESYYELPSGEVMVQDFSTGITQQYGGTATELLIALGLLFNHS